MALRTLLSATAVALVMGSISVAQTSDNALTQDTDQIEILFDQAEALRRGNGTAADLQQSVEIFEGLAAKDHARSMDRVGLAAWRGKGAALDLERGEEMFRKAVAAGHTKSLISLGRLLGEAGRGAEALAIFQQASASELGDAELWIARGHVDGTFGALSDPQAGQKTLKTLVAAGDAKATFALAEALRGGGALAPDQSRSLALFEQLAADGDPNAHYRVGTAYMRGIGTTPDLDRAIEAYSASAALGRTGALVNLGRAQSAAGQGPAARETLEKAVNAGVGKAQFWLARGHFERQFGQESDYALGADMLFELADAGSLDAATAVVKSSRTRAIRNRDFTKVIRHLEASAAQNNGRAAETLVAFYRLRPQSNPASLELRRTLLETKGTYMSPSVLLSEQIELAADTGTRAERWKNIDALLASVDDPLYARGLITAYKADRRAYTYHLQRNLAERGFYTGQISGWMTARTIASFRRYCKSEGIDDICTHGPLRVDAVRAMAQLWG